MSIPEELRRRNQWVCWRYVNRPGKDKPDKVPFDPRTGKPASTTDSLTWSPFDEAVAASEEYSGIGFVFSSGDPYAGIDLDHCRDPETGALLPEAAKIVAGFGGYVEVSPSGTGVHIIVKGKAPNKKRGGYEAYSSGRFFTITGDAIGEVPTEIPNRQDVLDRFCAKYLPDPTVNEANGTNGHGPVLEDEEIIRRCRKAKNAPKFASLYDDGDASAHGGDASKADFALIGVLGHYTTDTEQLERLMRRSALARPKWDERRGGQSLLRYSITRALSGNGGAPPAPRPKAAPEPAPQDEPEPQKHVNPLLAGRVDLAGVIEGGIEPPEQLEEGLLLVGRMHQVFSASGMGKTMFALYLMKRRIEARQAVVYFDAENGTHTIAERLKDFGVDATLIREHLIYLPFPTLTMDAATRVAYENLLDELNPALVVFDSWASFLSGAGLSENDNSEVESWNVAFAQSAKKRNITSLILDHVPHDGIRSRGAARKKEAADVLWKVKCTMPFNRDTTGEIIVTNEKDREGWLPGSVAFSVGGDGSGRIIFRQTSGTIENEDPTTGLKPSAKKVLDTLRSDFPTSGATPSEILPHLGFSRQTYYRAKGELIGKGLAREDNGSRIYALESVTPGGGAKPSDVTSDVTSSGSRVTSSTPPDVTPEAAYLSPKPEMYHDVTSVYHPENVTAAEDVTPPTPAYIGGVGVTPPDANPREREDHAGFWLTSEQAEKYERLIREGWGSRMAREEVLGEVGV